MKAAMRAKDSARLSAVRLLLAALKQKEVDERKASLTDAEVTSVIEKMIKQRRESIAQFEKGGRADLAAAEKFELDVLSAYLPQQMSETQIQEEVQKAISESGAAGIGDMGKVMAVLKSRLAGRADMGKVSSLVKIRLT